MLHEQESWLAAHRAEIPARIDEGHASAQRGELPGSQLELNQSGQQAYRRILRLFTLWLNVG